MRDISSTQSPNRSRLSVSEADSTRGRACSPKETGRARSRRAALFRVDDLTCPLRCAAELDLPAGFVPQLPSEQELAISVSRSPSNPKGIQRAGFRSRQQCRPSPQGIEEEDAARRSFPRDETPRP